MKKQFYFVSFFLGLLVHIAFLFFFVDGLQAEFSKSSRWRYIVIHHSGTRIGNLQIFDNYHRRRGMKNGAAYHFVIGNGTADKGDGQIEVSSRWKRQIEGGHCRQRWVNKIGIGICLVGNFDHTRPTRKQMHSLVSLCKLLRSRYYIPLSNIKGHGHIKGEKTNCPGKNFSIQEFKKMLVEEEQRTFKISD
ncbi:MAG: N-acetylmuramoyl-L-alanine amidase [Candidatus Aureabacteria bacterium]|nr:N-acetylmuramoyl-L-alanine amidase [Candidatus Auribacterota bacterium]